MVKSDILCLIYFLVPLQPGYREQPQNCPYRPERRRIVEPQRGQLTMPDVPVARGGVGVEMRGCGTGWGGSVTVSATVDAGMAAPSVVKSCSACARVPNAANSSLSLQALAGNASSRAFALQSVPSPLRIVDSNFAFSAAKRPRNARSSVTS
jgi:hypothetical protein